MDAKIPYIPLVIAHIPECVDKFRHTDGFNSFSIDGTYVEGVSITHGSPRSYIWTFVVEISEAGTECPCEGGPSALAFVGDNYYCESEYNGTGNHPSVLYTSDPLWDGAGCECEGSCCNTAPWFIVDLGNSTTDDIEARICSTLFQTSEDTPI